MARGDIRSDWYVALGTSNLDIQPADGDEYLITGWASETNGPVIHGRAGSDHTGPFQLGDFGAMTANASIIDTSGYTPVKIPITYANFIEFDGQNAGVDIGYSILETK